MITTAEQGKGTSQAIEEKSGAHKRSDHRITSSQQQKMASVAERDSLAALQEHNKYTERINQQNSEYVGLIVSFALEPFTSFSRPQDRTEVVLTTCLICRMRLRKAC